MDRNLCNAKNYQWIIWVVRRLGNQYCVYALFSVSIKTENHIYAERAIPLQTLASDEILVSLLLLFLSSRHSREAPSRAVELLRGLEQFQRASLTTAVTENQNTSAYKHVK
jgi:hypothetical protein